MYGESPCRLPFAQAVTEWLGHAAQTLGKVLMWTENTAVVGKTNLQQQRQTATAVMR